MLDLNRALDDVDWGMISDGLPLTARDSQANRRARSGLGLIPRRLSGLGEVWKSPVSQSDLDDRIDAIPRLYHATLAQEPERKSGVEGKREKGRVEIRGGHYIQNEKTTQNTRKQ